VVAVRYDWGYTELICTAVLTSETTALTAKHCTQTLRAGAPSGAKFVFQIGPNSSAPTKEVDIVDSSEPPAALGGFTGIGYDVAAVHLGEAVTDVAPLPWAALEADALGHTYVGIGYGVQDNNGTLGTRKLGAMTLRARSGRVYELLFGSFEAFFEWFAGDPLPPECAANGDEDSGVPVAGRGGSGGVGGTAGVDAGDPFDPGPCQLVPYARDIYATQMLEAAQVIAGSLAGEAQACYGDSGGPLLRKRADGKLTVYGVVNGGVASPEAVCDHGTVFTTFDPTLLTFIDRANKWVDPCNGLSTVGRCSGTVAERCSTFGEGKRRKLGFDCAAVGLTCKTQDDGSIGCGDDDTYLRQDRASADAAAFDPKAAERAAFRQPSSYRH